MQCAQVKQALLLGPLQGFKRRAPHRHGGWALTFKADAVHRGDQRFQCGKAADRARHQIISRPFRQGEPALFGQRVQQIGGHHIVRLGDGKLQGSADARGKIGQGDLPAAPVRARIDDQEQRLAPLGLSARGRLLHGVPAMEQGAFIALLGIVDHFNPGGPCLPRQPASDQ